jgi:hypothetical protein
MPVRAWWFLPLIIAFLMTGYLRKVLGLATELPGNQGAMHVLELEERFGIITIVLEGQGNMVVYTSLAMH